MREMEDSLTKDPAGIYNRLDSALASAPDSMSYYRNMLLKAKALFYPFFVKKILRLYKGLLTFATRSFLMEIALVLSVSVFELWKWKRPFLCPYELTHIRCEANLSSM